MAGSRQKQLEWSVRAARDVLAIDSYLSAENPKAALEVINHIVNRAEQLRRHPLIGRSLGARRPRKLVLFTTD